MKLLRLYAKRTQRFLYERRRLLVAAAIVVLLGTGITWGVRAWPRAKANPTHYDVVGRGNVEIKVSETGTIEPLKKVEVKSKVAGRIAHLYVDDGYVVRAGQRLAEIEPTEINSQVAQIQAQLDGARARYERAVRTVGYQQEQTRTGVQNARQALASAEARLKIAREEDRSQPRLTASAVAQALAALKAARDSQALLENSTHPQAVIQAQSGYDDAAAGEESAGHNLERQQRLLAKGFVAQQAVDTARSQRATATARLQQAKARLDRIQEQNRLEIENARDQVAQQQAALENARAGAYQVATKDQEVSAAQAAVGQARAQLGAALSNRSQDMMRRDDVADARATVVQLENQLRENQVHQRDTGIDAAMAGVVTKRYIEEGELVTSGVSSFSSGTPILQIADLSQMLVKMSVNEVDVHKIHAGLPVEVTIDAARGKLFRGRVRKVAPAAITSGTSDSGQPAPGSGSSVIRFAVEVLVDRADPLLKPGMSARCSIIVARRRGVLRLPNESVAGDGAMATVEVPTGKGKDGKDKFTRRHVVAGLRGDTFVEVRSGLRKGDRVKPGVYKGPKRKGIDIMNS